MSARKTPDALGKLAGRAVAAYEKAMDVLDQIEEAEENEATSAQIEKLETRYAEATEKAEDLKQETLDLAEELFAEFDQAHEEFWSDR